MYFNVNVHQLRIMLKSRAPTLRAMNSRIPPRVERRQWQPVYPVYARGHRMEGQIIKNSLPVDWVCPCGTQLWGNKSCPSCGRSPMDGNSIIDAPQHIAHSRDGKLWKKFVKRGAKK
ncbi:MAG: hypothetical protein ABR985_12090 [Methanotrichaceae archaeon]